MILITRPEEEAELFKEELDKFKIPSFIEPILIPKFYKINIEEIVDLDLIITSKNAIRSLLYSIDDEKNGIKNNVKNDIKNNIKINAMTDNIAKFAKFSGFNNVINFNCDNVLQFEQKVIRHFSSGTKFIYLSGFHITRDIVNNLKKQNFDAEQKITYEMNAVKDFTPRCVELLSTKKITAISIFSKRSAEIFKLLSVRHGISIWDFSYFVLSKEISAILDGCKIIIPKVPNQTSLSKEICIWFNTNS